MSYRDYCERYTRKRSNSAAIFGTRSPTKRPYQAAVSLAGRSPFHCAGGFRASVPEREALPVEAQLRAKQSAPPSEGTA